MADVVAPPETETSSTQLKASNSARIGIWLAAARLPVDWKYGPNLGQLGMIATFLLAPAEMFCGANALGRIREGRESGRALGRWTLTLGALGTAFALCLLVTR